jgi:hypothetical protein
MQRLLERRFRARVALENAWSHLADVERWPSWARHIRRVELRPAGAVGPASEGAIVLGPGLRSTFRVEQYRYGSSWKWAGPFLWLTVHYDHRFVRIGPKETEIHFAIDGEGAGVSFLGPLFAALYARNLDRAIPRLIAELELR